MPEPLPDPLETVAVLGAVFSIGAIVAVRYGYWQRLLAYLGFKEGSDDA